MKKLFIGLCYLGIIAFFTYAFISSPVKIHNYYYSGFMPPHTHETTDINTERNEIEP